MPRAFIILLLGLLLIPAAARAADLVFVNQSTGPVTVALIHPCGGSDMPLVQVAANSTTDYGLPKCKPPVQEKKDRSVRLAVFDKRTDQPGFFSMLIAAKAYVRVPAKVIIDRQYCEECDTRYKIAWIPLKKK